MKVKLVNRLETWRQEYETHSVVTGRRRKEQNNSFSFNFCFTVEMSPTLHSLDV